MKKLFLKLISCAVVFTIAISLCGFFASAETYTLTFNTNGGVLDATLSNPYTGTFFPSGYVPTREGYTFSAWVGRYGEYRVGQILTTSETVTARWSPNTFNIISSSLPITVVNGKPFTGFTYTAGSDLVIYVNQDNIMDISVFGSYEAYNWSQDNHLLTVYNVRSNILLSQRSSQVSMYTINCVNSDCNIGFYNPSNARRAIYKYVEFGSNLSIKLYPTENNIVKGFGNANIVSGTFDNFDYDASTGIITFYDIQSDIVINPITAEDISVNLSDVSMDINTLYDYVYETLTEGNVYQISNNVFQIYNGSGTFGITFSVLCMIFAFFFTLSFFIYRIR